MIDKKKFIFSLLLIFFSIFIIYVFIFLFYLIFLDKNLKHTFKHTETVKFYKRYIDTIEHLRFEDSYQYKKIERELIFNLIKAESDRKIILFQGDSWMKQLNNNRSTQIY